METVQTRGASRPARLAFGLDGTLDFARAPLTVAWEITRACHLKCLHCRATAQPHRSPDELTTAEGLDLIAQAAAIGVKVFVITGGDPLTRPDVLELITAVEASGMHCGFSPSVTRRLTPARLARAVAAGAASIHISLDGARPETHDAFRGVPGSFGRALVAIDAVADLGVRLQVATSVSRRTVADLRDVPPLIAGRVSLWSLFFLVPTGRAQAGDVLDADETEEVLGWLASSDLPFPVRTIAAPTYRRVLAQLGRQTGPAVGDGDGFAFVSHTGDVYPSGFLQLRCGSVREQPFAEIYRESPAFVGLRDHTLLTGRCGACEFRELCGGSRARAYAMTGALHASDPTCAHVPGRGPR